MSWSTTGADVVSVRPSPPPQPPPTVEYNTSSRQNARNHFVVLLDGRYVLLPCLSLVPRDYFSTTGEALESGDTAKVARNERFLRLLRNLSADKIDFATAHLLSHWDSFSGGDEARVTPCFRLRETSPDAKINRILLHMSTTPKGVENCKSR